MSEWQLNIYPSSSCVHNTMQLESELRVADQESAPSQESCTTHNLQVTSPEERSGCWVAEGQRRRGGGGRCAYAPKWYTFTLYNEGESYEKSKVVCHYGPLLAVRSRTWCGYILPKQSICIKLLLVKSSSGNTLRYDALSSAIVTDLCR